jgi:hypothetical protein
LCSVGASSCKDSADTVFGFKVTDGNLKTVFGKPPNEKVPDSAIKFGKEGKDNTIKIGLSSQDLPDEFKIFSIVSFSIYLFLTFLECRRICFS